MRRLDQAADALVQKLLGFALDGQAPDQCKSQQLGIACGPAESMHSFPSGFWWFLGA
jgi:hypothetical protein